MVALAREPLTARDVRRLVYGLLPHWGSIIRDGTPRATTWNDCIVRGHRAGQPLPAPAWHFDLCRAFAALNPATAGLADDGSTAWVTHVSFNDQQRAIWAYYVVAPDAGGVDTRAADATIFAHQREHELQHAIKAHDSKRDASVAKLLHLDSWKVRRLRSSAVWTMATLVGWERDERS